MSCWVVPSVAAEIFGVPVSEILRRVKAGEMPTKLDLGFTLVDMAPEGPRMETGKGAIRPLTYVPVEGTEPAAPSELYHRDTLTIEEGRREASRLRRPKAPAAARLAA